MAAPYLTIPPYSRYIQNQYNTAIRSAPQNLQENNQYLCSQDRAACTQPLLVPCIHFSYNQEYKIIRLLGKGKGGYSYLASDGERQYVLKQIHHEPCSYYQFGNKLQAEINDYDRLKKIGIRVPEMIDAYFLTIYHYECSAKYFRNSSVFDQYKIPQFSKSHSSI